MEEELSILNIGRYGEQRPVTDKYKSMETPDRLRDRCELLPHQKTILAAIVELEDKRVIKVLIEQKGMQPMQFLQSQAIRLNERYGSGKTLIILALIAVRPIPKAFPAIRGKCTVDEIKKYGRRNKEAVRNNYVEIRYDVNSLIRPNLIIVSSGVLIQWETAILKFTDFKVFTISGYYDMLKFKQVYDSGDIRAFDIVLLKNGKIMGKFDFTEIETDSSINILNTITKGRCWSRVIYDDFDTINIPMRTEVVETLFTIFVSATEKAESESIKGPPITYNNVQEMISYSKSMLKDTFYDRGLMGNFSVKAAQEYTEASTQLPKISQFECVYVNPNENIIRLAGAMRDDEAREIVEMMNSDALDTAAARLGIKSNSVADIFQRMLGQKHERLLSDNKTLDVIAETRNYLKTLGHHPKNKATKIAKLDEIQAQIRKKVVPKIKYYCNRIVEVLDDLTVEYTASRDHNRLAIDRVIDNIKEGDCQICQIPLVDESAFIIRCCGIIVCGVCCMKGNQIALRYHYASRGNVLYGKCANCKSDVFPHQDLIYVDNNFDLDSLINARGDEKPEDAFAEDAPVEMVEEPAEQDPILAKIAKIENPKHRAIIRLCHGMEPEECKALEYNVKGLILGSADRPRPDNRQAKILIFAPYTETLNGIENTLLDFNISYVNLKGTAREKAANVEEFKLRSTVMLANSNQDCAGLDLQMADYVVFYNKIFDQNIEGQIAGRIQRFGRVYNGKIYYLKYQNETAGNFGA